MKDFMSEPAWRMGHDLAMAIYRACDRFPESEPEILPEGLRSAALMLEGRIEDGFLENGSRRGRSCFGIAIGKLAKIESLIISCSDLELLSSGCFRKLRAEIGQLRKTLWKLAGLSGHARQVRRLWR